MRLQESHGGFTHQGVGWLVLGIDINRDYLAIAALTPSLRTLWGFVDYYLGRLQSSPLTRPLTRQTNRPTPLKRLLPLETMGPLRLSVVVGNGVKVPAWAYAILMPLPPRLPTEHPLHRRYSRWRRLTISYFFTSLSPLVRKSGTLLITALEDLRGMARRRGLSEIEYSRIWRYALGLNNAERQPVINKKGYRVLLGRSGSIVIAVDPRGTSSVCAVCNANGEETKVKENDDRTIQCPTHGKLNRDTNAALNIAIEGLRILTRHYKAIMTTWQEATKTTKPGERARALGGQGEGPHTKAPMNPTQVMRMGRRKSAEMTAEDLP